jgi:hypothetical protein
VKLGEHKNSKKQGDAGLGSAIGYFTSRGYMVALPLTDSHEYDLIVEIDNQLKKVQVKTTTVKTPYDIYQVELRTLGGNQSYNTAKFFDATKIDYLFILTNEQRYCIPCNIITSKTSINMGDKYKEYIV